MSVVKLTARQMKIHIVLTVKFGQSGHLRKALYFEIFLNKNKKIIVHYY